MLSKFAGAVIVIVIVIVLIDRSYGRFNDGRNLV